VPLRVELGPRDLEAGQAVLAWRVGTDGKDTVALAGLAASLPDRLRAYHDRLLARAVAFRDAHTTVAGDWDEFAAGVDRGFALALHCGRSDCEDDIKAETTATPRCIPRAGEPAEGACVRCAQPSAYGTRVVFARAY
jgi:prolyl-tRNA synthetase